MNSSFFHVTNNLFFTLIAIILVISLIFIPTSLFKYNKLNKNFYIINSNNIDDESLTNLSNNIEKDLSEKIKISFKYTSTPSHASKTTPNIEENKVINNFSNDNTFIWPIPGFTRISSKFGKRTAPTSGASTSHSGIDIPAPTGTNILSIMPGKVTFTGFKGAGGYTITVKNGIFEVSYCHVSPKFIFSVGNYVDQGILISHVGPLNVYNVSNNPYKDKKGNPTNGASTGPHLHLTIKKNGKAVDPLSFL